MIFNPVTGSYLLEHFSLVDRPHGQTGVVFCRSWREADRLIDEFCIALGLSGVRYSTDAASGRYHIRFGKHTIRFNAVCPGDAAYGSTFHCYSGLCFEWVWDLVGIVGSGLDYMSCRVRCLQGLDTHWNGEVFSPDVPSGGL